MYPILLIDPNGDMVVELVTLFPLQGVFSICQQIDNCLEIKPISFLEKSGIIASHDAIDVHYFTDRRRLQKHGLASNTRRRGEVV